MIVDHLYNRARALNYGLQYVRLALVRHAVNRSHGAAYEKDITKNEAGREKKDMKLMDEITSMKYFGFLSPLRDDPLEAEVDAYAAFAAAKLGLDPQDTAEYPPAAHEGVDAVGESSVNIGTTPRSAESDKVVA